MKAKFQLILKSVAAIPSELFSAAKKVPPAMFAAQARSKRFARKLLARRETPFRSLAPQPRAKVWY